MAVIIKEQLSDLKEQYEGAMQLVEEQSKMDSETDPYKSHYCARDIFLEIQSKLKVLVDDKVPESEDAALVYKSLLGYIYKDLGQLHIFVEESTTGRKYLEDAITLLEPIQSHPEAVIALITCFNELSVRIAASNDRALAKIELLKSKELYEEFKKSDQNPLSITDLFGYGKGEPDLERAKLLLEKSHTLTLYYLAQVEDTADKSSFYLHATLKRQLQFNDYDSLDWALNAATFSQFFFSSEGMKHSKHHLAAATYVLDEYEKVMIKPEMNEEEQNAAKEKFQNCYADVDRCWAMYCYHILAASKERLMKDEDGDDGDTLDQSSTNVAGGKKLNVAELAKLKAECGNLEFPTIDVKSYESLVTDEYVLVMEDAEKVFQFALQHLNHAKEYYTSETHASDYAKIIQDISSLYNHLAFFEEDESRQCKIHKKRADELEVLAEMLNPVYYKAICRELRYELGLTYNKMLNIKLDRMTADPNVHAINKVNKLSVKSILNFTKFIESYHSVDADSREDIYSKIDDEEMPPLLFSYFYMGRLYYKIITPDKRKLLSNITNSLKYYNFFLEGCNKTKKYASLFKQEVSVCREMTNLLPRLIQKTLLEIRTMALNNAQNVPAIE